LREVRELSLLLSSLNGFIADYGIHISSLSFVGGLIRRSQLARKKGSWRETMMDLGYTGVADAAMDHALNFRIRRQPPMVPFNLNLIGGFAN
jgi:hypothetical protein